ncbi:MAG: CDP-glycerol glycerophosphotransferase family protein [Sulfurovaceae bacterium]|nr:CDP-glycerol glycerophosphotransferase family protein [Sulfurovaceae bacterium]
MTLLGLKKLILHPKIFLRDYRNKGKGKGKGSIDLNNTNLLSPFTHLLHTGEDKSGISHLDLWIPYFMQSEVLFLVVIRNFIVFERIKEKYPLVNIVYARKDKEINNILNRLPRLKACFYPSNTGNNLHLLKFNDVRHIFIGHGDSDKMSSAHKYFRVYDENWVASDAHIDRFKNERFDFSGLKSVKVGRPNLFNILENTKEKWNKRFGSKLNLLYLSTWEGVYTEQNYTSVYMIKDIINVLKELENIQLSVKLHPRVGSRDFSLLETNDMLKAYTKENNIACNIYERDKPVDELIIKSNIFICDISAVVSECLAANAPIFVYIPKDKTIKLSQSNMKFEDYTYTFSSVLELSKKLTEVLKGNDYLQESREKAMEYILGKEATLNQQFIKELKNIEA